MASDPDRPDLPALSRRELLAAAAAAGCAPGEILVGAEGGAPSGTGWLDTGWRDTGASGPSDTAGGGITSPGPSTRPTSARRPNVLLLFPDQWRGQAMGHVGDRNALTPVVDALAAESVAFTEAVTNSAVCTPARSLLLTGVMPWVHGMDENGARLRDGVPTLGTTLRSAGYRCGWIGKWHLEGHGSTGYVPPGRRFGFDDAWAANNFHHRYLAPELFFDSPVPVRRDDVWQPVWETDLAIEAIDAASQGGQPWFLTVSWGAPHPNLHSPADWRLDMPDDLMDVIDPSALAFRDNVPRDILEPWERDPWGVRGFLHGYYAAIRAMDAQVGRLLDHLETAGLADDTLVVFTSDHGEMGGSHGLYKKGIFFDEALLVPLLFRWPGGFGGGRRYRAGASLLDLAPTLMRLCTDFDLDDHELHGRDLTPWLTGEAPDDPQQVSFISRKASGALAWRGVRTATHKLVTLLDGREVLFDRVADPYEMADALDDGMHAVTLGRLRDQLAQWRERTFDPSVGA